MDDATQVLEAAAWAAVEGVATTEQMAMLEARPRAEEPHELVTPTGAALLAELVQQFGPMDALIAERIGFGLGTRQNKTRPNVLRAVLGESASSEKAAHDWESDTVWVLEANIDDLNPEILGQFIETALEAGALDVFHTPIQMKKNRPGILLTLLCEPAKADALVELLHQHGALDELPDFIF